MARSITASETCPMDLGINILAGKWKLSILWRIYQNKGIRFNELQRQVGDITTKTLTAQLKELADLQIIQRIVYPENPPHVEYSFTTVGTTLIPVLRSLCDWGKAYQHHLAQER
ncbi:MAG: helix-turn-helix transcriptional regulator [Enterococcaceae bacterium]|nr:helix-turn-helix transcriptional regulator [Enterococcaceae bacterium]